MPLDRHETMQHVFHRSVGRIRVRVDWTGLHNVHCDASGPEIPGQPAGQSLQRGLAQRVGSHAGNRHAVSVDGPDHDDPPVLRHTACRLNAGVVRRVNVDAQQPINGVWIKIERVPEDADAGIDHQHVQRTAFTYHGDHRIAIRAVDQQSGAARFNGQLLRRCSRAGVSERDHRAVCGETSHYDPDLTLDLPARLTAATGMDAIAHCIETFMAPAFNPPADGIALDGLWRAWAHIERATREPHDREARLQMMSASMQGAMAFQKGLGCVHSLSHSLGGLDPSLHHGMLNAVFLPAVIEFNEAATTVRNENKLARLAHAMDLADSSSVGDAITAMNRRLGLPTRLREMNVSESMFPRIVEGALQDHSHMTNPRPAEASDYARMLARAR